jgi:hypothetical protein
MVNEAKDIEMCKQIIALAQQLLASEEGEAKEEGAEGEVEGGAPAEAPMGLREKLMGAMQNKGG